MSISLHPDTPQTRTLPSAAAGGSVSGKAGARGIRTRLFTKYVALFVAVVAIALLANGLFEVFFYYREHKASLIRVQHEQAEAAAAKISQFVKEIESQLGWTTQLPWSPGSIEQRRFDALRLLRQVPAITELAQVDSTGKERLRVSRLAMDAIDSGIDLSSDLKFTEAVAHKVYYGPVYFRREFGALHDVGAGRRAQGCGRQHCRGQSQADLGRRIPDQGRRARTRLCGRPGGAADRASRYQPGFAQHRPVGTGAGARRARRRRRHAGRLAGSDQHPGTEGSDGVRADRPARLDHVRRAAGRGGLCGALCLAAEACDSCCSRHRSLRCSLGFSSRAAWSARSRHCAAAPSGSAAAISPSASRSRPATSSKALPTSSTTWARVCRNPMPTWKTRSNRGRLN